MKAFVSFLFLFLCFIGFSQNLQAQDYPLKAYYYGPFKGSAIEWLESSSIQNKVRYNFRNQDLKSNQKYSVIDSIKIEDMIKQICFDLKLNYKYLGNSIVVLQAVHKSKGMVLSGFVRDNESYDVLPSALLLDIHTGKTVFADEEGHFIMHLDFDTGSVLFVYSGYEPFLFKIRKPGDKVLNVYLNPGVSLGEAVITGKKDTVFFRQYGQYFVFNDEIRSKLPSLLGNSDALNNIGFLPGIHSMRDISPGIIVRGGGPDQNLMLIDGVPNYNPSHLFGLVSVLDGSMLQSMKVYKDAFPANYGGRLSSVMDVKTRNGNMSSYRGKANLSVLMIGAEIEGPIIKGKSSFLLSARRSYSDLWLNGIRKTGLLQGFETEPGYFFFDINFKCLHHFNPHSFIQVSMYSGSDQGGVRNNLEIKDSNGLKELSSFKLRWNSNTGQVKWTFAPKSKSLHHVSAFFTDYQVRYNDYYRSEIILNQKTVATTYNLEYLSGIRDIGLRSESNFQLNEKNHLSSGAVAILHQFEPGRNSYFFENSDKISIDTFNGIPDIQSVEINLFASHKYKPEKNVVLEAGLHQAFYLFQQKQLKALQPRFASEIKLGKNVSWLLDCSRMVQFIHLVPNNNLGLPFDIWLPVTGNLKPFSSWQASSGFFVHLNKWEYHVDVYLKKQTELLELRDGANIILASGNWEKELTAGNGQTQGVEQMIRYQDKKNTLWLSYALSKSDRSFSEINGGEIFPFKYDRRHQITFVATRAFSQKWNGSLNWVYLSGNPVTIPENQYVIDLEGNTYPIELLGQRNNYRMQAYHRLDVSFNKTITKKWGHVVWDFGVFNAYNQYNPYYLYFGYAENGERVLKLRSLLPVLPSVSFSAQFK